MSRSTSPIRSARVDSGMPVVRTTSERITRPVAAAASRGSTSCSSSIRISKGTPGSMMTRPGGPLSQRPGAVPHRFRRTAAPSGISAWLRLLATGTRPKRRNRSIRFCHTDSSKCSGAPNSSATTFLLMSSRVGPSPPVVSTAPVRPSASPTAARIASGLSATAVRRVTRTPRPARPRAISAPLVSTVKPSSSSVPMVTSSMSMPQPALTATGPKRARDSGRGRGGRSTR